MTPELFAFVSVVFFFASIFALVTSNATKLVRTKVSQALAPQPHDVNVEEDDVKLRIAVFFGTQTGTSERFAREVEAELNQRYGTAVCVRTADLENVTPDLADESFCAKEEPLAIFLQSTYGDGEPTDTSTEFVHQLRDLAGSGKMSKHLQKLTFSVFGLGNSSYEHFNAAAKLLDKSLEQLGATRLVDIYLGDDDGSLEDDFQSWKECLWAEIEGRYCISAANSCGNDLTSYVVISASMDDAEAVHQNLEASLTQNPAEGRTSSTAPYSAQVCRAFELHSNASDRSCVHVDFNICGTGICYQHGDHLGVFAENSLPVVQRGASCLNYQLDYVFTLTIPSGAPASLSTPFPTPCTLKAALTKYADLLSPPRKTALAALASVSSNPAQKARLYHLASAAGKQEYNAYIVDPGRSLLEVLEAFPSAVPPLGLFFGFVSARLAPRFYSISCSPLDNPGIVSASVAVVREERPTGRLHEGVASSFLARYLPEKGERNLPAVINSHRVPLFVHPSHFKLPRNASTPVVMIGPGTGFAPFRGFLQERAALRRCGKLLGPAYLFSGCRSEHHDFIYREEMEDALANETISELHVAFSREFSNRKVYVQDKLMEFSSKLNSVMKDDQGCAGSIYICGNAKGMARDVNRALHSILIREGGYAGYEAEGIIAHLSEAGRYQKDVW